MKKPTRFALLALGTIVLGIAALQTWERVDYDRAAWCADLAQLEAHMARGYANLDWAAKRRGLDLVQLHRDTLAALDAAPSSAVATSVIEEFVERFEDPHLVVERPAGAFRSWLVRTFHSTPRGESEAPPAEVDAALDMLGYRDGRLAFRVDFSAAGGFERSPGAAPFPAGVLTLANGRRVGVLRIADFRPTRYRSVAAETWPAFHRSRGRNWTDAGELAFQTEVCNELLARLARRVEELAALKIDALLVDVTGNGGGTEWANEAARVFTTRPLAPPRAAFIRHPHWAAQFEDQAQEIALLLARQDLRPSTRTLLEAERVRLATCLIEARRVVDRSRIWTDASAPREELLYAGDAIREPAWPQDVLDELGGRRLRAREGAWSGRLFVLVDRGSASATEAFVAMLQDNEAATIVGARTLGAGQGYTSGGIPCELANSGLRVLMPDSARLRKDGSPEIEGVEPDVAIPWSDGESGASRARKTIEALAKIDLAQPASAR